MYLASVDVKSHQSAHWFSLVTSVVLLIVSLSVLKLAFFFVNFYKSVKILAVGDSWQARGVMVI